MSGDKKRIREEFRDVVFKRDGNRCRICGWSLNTPDCHLDAHHITDRKLMPNGGYVAENGISLCPAHHEDAEIFHSTGVAKPGFSSEDLYRRIGSTYEQAVAAAERLK